MEVVVSVSAAEVMQALAAVSPPDTSGWTVAERVEYLRASQSLIEAVIDLQLRTRKAQAAAVSHPARTVETSKG
jgi:hypothetical protein